MNILPKTGMFWYMDDQVRTLNHPSLHSPFFPFPVPRAFVLAVACHLSKIGAHVDVGFALSILSLSCPGASVSVRAQLLLGEVAAHVDGVFCALAVPSFSFPGASVSVRAQLLLGEVAAHVDGVCALAVPSFSFPGASVSVRAQLLLGEVAAYNNQSCVLALAILYSAYPSALIVGLAAFPRVGEVAASNLGTFILALAVLPVPDPIRSRYQLSCRCLACCNNRSRQGRRCSCTLLPLWCQPKCSRRRPCNP